MSHDHDKRGERSWRYYFGALVSENAGVKMRPRTSGAPGVTSNRTQEMADQTVMLLVGVLRGELGFKVMKPGNLDARHMQALAEWMNAKRTNGELLPATLAGYATTVRKLVRWAGKPGLVNGFDEYLDAHTTERHLAAEYDKTFEGNDVDIEQAILDAYGMEPWAGMAMLYQHSFGGRRREACCHVPKRDIDLAAGVVRIPRNMGAKGGRPREIRMLKPEEVEAANRLLDFISWRNLSEGRQVNAYTSLAPATLSLKQALDRYSYVCQCVGLTREDAGVVPHGLRAGFVCRRLEDGGIKPVIWGGSGRHADPSVDRLRKLLLSEDTGHSRVSVVGAYAAAPGVMERVIASEYLGERGLLLPGKDTRSIDINAQRVTDFLARERELIAGEVAARKAGHGRSQMPLEQAVSAGVSAETGAGDGESTVRESQPVQSARITALQETRLSVSSKDDADAGNEQRKEC